MMPEQVLYTWDCGPIRPLGVVPLSIRIGRQLSPGQTLFLLLLSPPFFFGGSAAFTWCSTTTNNPNWSGRNSLHFLLSPFHGSSSKVTRILLQCGSPPPAEMANDLASLFISLSLGCVNHPALTRRWMRSTATTRIAAINIKDGNERETLLLYIRMDRLRRTN